MAFRLGTAFSEAGIEIKAVINRNRDNGEKLVRALKRHGQNTEYFSDFDTSPVCDITVIAVSDDAIPSVAGKIGKSRLAGKTAVVHTSGATDISVLETTGCRYGVFYPLMTLSKSKDVNFNIVPFMLESEDPELRDEMRGLVESLGAEYRFCSSQDRLRMHAAAVFSCNFVSYMLSIAQDIVKDNPVFLMPLTIETVRKYFMMLNPDLTITGPARRGDITTLEKHIGLLEDMGMHENAEMYRYISEAIMKKFGSGTTEIKK